MITPADTFLAVIECALLATLDAFGRTDCDIAPRMHEIDIVSEPGWVMVDIAYSSRGYRALYGMRIDPTKRVRGGRFSLWQD